MAVDNSNSGVAYPGDQAAVDAGNNAQSLRDRDSTTSSENSSGTTGDPKGPTSRALQDALDYFNTTSSDQQSARSSTSQTTTASNTTRTGNSLYSYQGGQQDSIDMRIRLRPYPKASSSIYGDSSSVLSIIKETNGVIFPYTPTISGLSHSVNYTAIDVTHSNQEYYAYKNTETLKLTISGQFTAENYREAQYMFAAIHFLRSCTKMHFGDSDNNRGLPPPVLLLSGYGTMMFNDLPVIITNVTYDYPNTVDLVPVFWNVGGNTSGPIAWVPVIQTITVSITVQNTPKRMRDFDWYKYSNGSLLTSKPGGFI